MLLPFRAFLLGWGRALARPRLTLLLYVINLLLSAAVAVPVYRLASRHLALDPEVHRLLARYDAWYAGDLVRAQSGLLEGLSASTAVAAVLFLLAFSFVGGAFYRTLAETDYRPRFPAFLADGARCFWRFARLLVPAAIATALIAAANGPVSRAVTHFYDVTLDRSASAWALGLGLAGKTALFVWLFLLLVTAPLQFARTAAALGERRSMLRAYIEGVGLALRRPFSVAWAFALTAVPPIALLLLHDLALGSLSADVPWRPLDRFGWRFDPALPYWLVVLLLEQLLVLLLALAFTARTGALVALRAEIVQARAEEPRPEGPSPAPAPFVADSPGTGGRDAP